jgi:prepilin-type N-terminal cleavage/methylation domain-containing protein
MKRDPPKGFTLIELLVVIGILGTLATAVVLVLNPAQLLAQARDSTRLSDLASLNQTLSLFQTDQYNRSLGTSSVVYVSVPDSSPTCLNLGLPTLPGGWSYGCAPASTLQKVDGTGWIPVPLNLISSGSPLSKLPIDPVNATSSGNYYTYTPGGSWELTTILESQKQKMGGGSDKTSTDGGSYPELYEVGTNLTLLPVDYGDPSLVGYWKFDEGTGGTAYDASGHNATGTWSGTGGHWTAGRVGAYAGNFNGTDDKVSVPHNNNLNANTGDLTVSFWEKSTKSVVGYSPYLYKNSGFGGTLNNWAIRQWVTSGRLETLFADNASYANSANTTDIADGSWKHLVVVFSRGAGMLTYVNGSLNYTGAAIPSGNQGGTSLLIIGGQIGTSYDFLNGSLDDVRIYNRALSAAEIQAIYRAAN